MGITNQAEHPRDGFFSGDDQLRTELRATVRARRDLGPRYEPELIDSFMDRVRPRLNARIEQRLAPARPAAVERPRLRTLALGAGAVIAAFVLALPAVGGVVAGAPHAHFARHQAWVFRHERMLNQQSVPQMIDLPNQQRVGQGSSLPNRPLILPVAPVNP